MTLLNVDRTLKRDPSEIKLLRTHQGMAHIAGTGPAGMQCGHCLHFSGDALKPYGPAPKAARCLMFTKLMRGQQGKPVPPTASACKYFEAR